MHKLLKNILFTVIILIVFVAAGELILRLATGPPMSEHGQPIAQRQEGQIEYALIPNIDREFAGARVVTNSLGLRDYRPPHKSDGKTQIIVLGDSFTFGYGVPLEESYPNLLEQRLNQAGPGDQYEVINAGVPGYDTVDEAELLEKILPSYSPRWVVVGLHPGDLISREELNKNVTVRTREWLRKHSALFSSLFRIYKTKMMKYVPPPRSALSVNPEKAFNSPQGDRIKEALKLIRDTANEDGADVIVLMIVPLVYWQQYPYVPLQQAVAGFCLENSIRFVDPLSEFEKHDAASLWVAPNDSHYNKIANGIVAGVLAEVILHNPAGAARQESGRP
jgi:hypothetical protein